MNISDYNVIFITVDSLPYTVAKSVEGLYLNNICSLQEAETHGTYTYPSHQSFFIGMLPRPVDQNYLYLGKYKQIWRSSLSRKSNKIVAITFDDTNILNHYRKLGHQVLGFGGVTYFDTNSKSNSLPFLFDKFIFFGPHEKKYNLRPFPRNREWFPLLHTDRIIGEIEKEPYFLFINSNATHVPYDNPESIIEEEDKILMNRLFLEHSSKAIHTQKNLPFTKNEHERLIDLQKKSLQWVDRKIEELLASLPRTRPTILIVCGDHGEEFGEGGRYGHAHAHRSVMRVPYWDCTLLPQVD